MASTIRTALFHRNLAIADCGEYIQLAIRDNAKCEVHGVPLRKDQAEQLYDVLSRMLGKDESR